MTTILKQIEHAEQLAKFTVENCSHSHLLPMSACETCVYDVILQLIKITYDSIDRFGSDVKAIFDDALNSNNKSL